MFGKARNSLRWVGVSDDGLSRPFDPASLEIDDDHVVRRERRIVDPARLDREDGPRPIDRARIAEGEIDEAVPRQGDIGLVGFTLEFLEHRLVPAQARNPCAR